MMLSGLNVTEEFVRLMNTLKDRKRKFDRLKLQFGFGVIVSSGLFLLLLNSFYKNVVMKPHKDVLDMLSRVIQNDGIIVRIFAFMTFFLVTSHLAKKMAKAKKKYESLRLEAIDRLNITWVKTRNSEVRDRISQEMKSKYGINLTYKS